MLKHFYLILNKILNTVSLFNCCMLQWHLHSYSFPNTSPGSSPYTQMWSILLRSLQYVQNVLLLPQLVSLPLFQIWGGLLKKGLKSFLPPQENQVSYIFFKCWDNANSVFLLSLTPPISTPLLPCPFQHYVLFPLSFPFSLINYLVKCMLLIYSLLWEQPLGCGWPIRTISLMKLTLPLLEAINCL